MEVVMKWYKSRAMYLMGFIGFLGGVIFLVAGTWLEFNRQLLPPTLWSFFYLHKTQPMIFMLDFAPLVMGFMAGLIGLQRNLFTTIEQAKKEWEATFDAFSDPIFVTDIEGNIIRCNHAVLDRMNIPYIKVVGKKLTEIIFEGQTEKKQEADVHGSEFSWLERLYEMGIYPIYKGELSENVICILHDITDRKEIENSLFVERNLLRTLIDNLPDRIYVKDTQGRKTLSNTADMQASGAKSMQEIIGKTDFDTYSPELANKFWTDDKFVMETETPTLNREEPGLDKDGGTVWIMTSKMPVKDHSGHVMGLVGIGRDITVKKNIELEIKRQKQFYETLISNSPVAIVVLDNDEKISSCNPAFENLFGYNSREILNVSLDALITTEETKEEAKQYRFLACPYWWTGRRLAHWRSTTTYQKLSALNRKQNRPTAPRANSSPI